jgi:topoisomerase-4 subunit B
MGSEPGMPSVRTFVNDFVKLDNYLHESSNSRGAVAKNSSS